MIQYEATIIVFMIIKLTYKRESYKLISRYCEVFTILQNILSSTWLKFQMSEHPTVPQGLL